MVDADVVLFDLDGVLVDSRVPFVRCVNAALLAHCLPARKEADLQAFIGPPLHRTFAELSAGEWVQSCVDTYRERYRTHAASETALFPGVLSMLERLGERFAMVVATSKPRALAEPLLRSLGIEEHFVAVVGPDLAVEHETKTVTIRRALNRAPASTRAVMVGDRHYDIAGAKANGLPAVGGLWGYRNRERTHRGWGGCSGARPTGIAGAALRPCCTRFRSAEPWALWLPLAGGVPVPRLLPTRSSDDLTFG